MSCVYTCACTYHRERPSTTRIGIIRIYRTKQHVGGQESLTTRTTTTTTMKATATTKTTETTTSEQHDHTRIYSWRKIGREREREERKKRRGEERREACEIAVQPTHTVVADRRGRQGTRASKMEGRRAWNIKGGTWIHISSGGSRCFAAERLFSRAQQRKRMNDEQREKERERERERGQGERERRIEEPRGKERLREGEWETREQPTVVAIVSVASATTTFEYPADRETGKEHRLRHKRDGNDNLLAKSGTRTGEAVRVE